LLDELFDQVLLRQGERLEVPVVETINWNSLRSSPGHWVDRRTSNWFGLERLEQVLFPFPTGSCVISSTRAAQRDGLFEMGFSELGRRFFPPGRPRRRRSRWRAHENG